jgi:hypothetical protein
VLMEIPEFATLEEAKQFLRNNWKDGVVCPCCTQMVKRYRRKFNSGMARGIIFAYKLDKVLPDQYFHSNTINKLANGQDIEFSKLRYWGLVEQMPNENEKKKHSGMWRITDKGRQFAKGQIDIESHVLLFKKKLYGFDGDKINIREALGKHFDYPELMDS